MSGPSDPRLLGVLGVIEHHLDKLKMLEELKVLLSYKDTHPTIQRRIAKLEHMLWGWRHGEPYSRVTGD